MIYFVSYVLGLASCDCERLNSENAISDHLETPNFRNFLKCSAFISAQLPFATKSKVPRAKIILYSLGRGRERRCENGVLCPCIDMPHSVLDLNLSINYCMEGQYN